MVAALLLTLPTLACTCPSPMHFDQLFLLDARPGAPLVAFDAGTDAMSIDPGNARDASLADSGAVSSDAGGSSLDASGVFDAAPADLPSPDCTSQAVGCLPGGDCLPACNCVLARGDLQQVVAIDGCRLVAGSGAPTVEVRYEVRVRCPGG